MNASSVFKGRNFMTPQIIEYSKGTLQGKTAYIELSTGRGIDNEKIWGVTVRDANGGRFVPEPSRMFHSLIDARDYMTEELHAKNPESPVY